MSWAIVGHNQSNDQKRARTKQNEHPTKNKKKKRRKKRKRKEKKEKEKEREKNSHRLFQTLLIHRHLDRNMREVVVDRLVRARRHCRVVFAVFMELCDGTDHERDVGDDLEGEELESWVRVRVSVCL